MTGSNRNEPITEYMYSRASRERIPLSGTFELSPLCNFSCRMCYVRKTAQEVGESPRPAMTADRWLGIAREAGKRGMLYLLLTGGEPLLWPDFPALYEELSKMGFVISVNTNGSLIGPRETELFRRFPPKRLNVTLYGACDGTYERLCGAKGAFSKVDGAIKSLKAAGISVKLNGSFTPDNVCDMERIVDYAAENGLPLQTSFYMFPPIRRDETMTGRNERFTPEQAAKYRLRCYKRQNGEESYGRYTESIRRGLIPPPGLDESCVDPLDGRIRCRAGRAAFWITWDGYMTPCGLMPRPAADLNEAPFERAWDELVKICDGLVLSGICVSCPNQKVCHACGAMALAETGEYSGIPKYLCRMTEEMKKIAENALPR